KLIRGFGGAVAASAFVKVVRSGAVCQIGVVTATLASYSEGAGSSVDAAGALAYRDEYGDASTLSGRSECRRLAISAGCCWHWPALSSRSTSVRNMASSAGSIT